MGENTNVLLKWWLFLTIMQIDRTLDIYAETRQWLQSKFAIWSHDNDELIYNGDFY